MKRRFVPVFILPVVAGLILGLAGCSKDNGPTQPTTPSTTADQQALKAQVTSIDSVAQFVASDEATIDDGDGLKTEEYNDLSGTMPMGTTLAKATGVADSIYPVRWGRHLDWSQVTVNYNVQIQGDTLATVLITRVIPGDFRVGLGTKTVDTTIVDTVIHKSFSEQINRRVMFKRIARTSNPLHNWLPIAITMSQGMTAGANTFQIVSFEVKDNTTPYDSTFIGPLVSWFRLGLFHGSVPVFMAGDSITTTVTVTSSDSAGEFVALRHGIAAGHPERRRLKMNLISTSGGAGSYTRVYQRSFRIAMPLWAMLAARFNLAVDVVAKSSVYDNTAPFMNEFWGMPYIAARW